MKILVAPDKFKGSLTAFEVCQAIEEGLLKADQTLQVQKIPLADGGEGSLEIISQHLDLQEVTILVQDPLGRTIDATYRISQEAAYIEMAQASGLDLLTTDERDCLYTSSYGTGQLMLDAYGRGLRKMYLFVGGSATSDGGIGVLDALGIHAIGTKGRLPGIGKSLTNIIGFEEIQDRVRGIDITVVCDVQNPLYGANGAAYVYAPQKGADAEAVELLDQGLRNLAQVILKSKGIRIDDFPGSGAAGGIAAGLKAFFTTNIQSGIAAIMEMVGLRQVLSESDLVITGEGKLDQQTMQGKVIKGVYDICQQEGKRLAIICGTLALDAEILRELGVWKVGALVRTGTSLEQALEKAYELVSQRAYELISQPQE